MCVFDGVRQFTTFLQAIYFTRSRIWHARSFSRSIRTVLHVLCLNYAKLYVTTTSWTNNSPMNQVFNPLRTLHFTVILNPFFLLYEWCLGSSSCSFVSHSDLWPPLATSTCFLHTVGTGIVTLDGAQFAMCGRSVVTPWGSFSQFSRNTLQKQYSASRLNSSTPTILYSENKTGFNFSRQESEMWTQKFQISEYKMPT